MAEAQTDVLYVVSYGIGYPEDGDAVLGVFSTRELAESAGKSLPSHYWIDECVLDVPLWVIQNG